MTDASERARELVDEVAKAGSLQDCYELALAALEAHAAEARADYVPKDWLGLMHILDDIYPEDIFPTLPDNEKRDIGPRLVSLLRYLDRERARAVSMATDVQTQTAALRIEQDRVRELEARIAGHWTGSCRGPLDLPKDKQNPFYGACVVHPMCSTNSKEMERLDRDGLRWRRERDEALQREARMKAAPGSRSFEQGWRAGRDAALKAAIGLPAYGDTLTAIRALEPPGEGGGE